MRVVPIVIIKMTVHVKNRNPVGNPRVPLIGMNGTSVVIRVNAANGMSVMNVMSVVANVKRAIRAIRAIAAKRVNAVHTALKDPRAPKAKKVRRARRVVKDQRDRKAKKVRRDPKDLAASHVNLAVQRPALSSQKAASRAVMRTKSIKLQIYSL